MKYFLRFFVVMTAFLAACEGEGDVRPSDELMYFPLQTGIYHVYDVTEKRYQAGSAPMETSYQVRTQITDSFPSETGFHTYVIHQTKRAGPDGEWEPMETWSARYDNSAIVVSEASTPFVKLRFPLKEGSKWNGNEFNAMGTDEYTLVDVGVPLQVNGLTFARTVVVEQEYNDDVIVFRDFRKEIYAENAGLIYKEIVQLKYCTADHCLGLQKVDEGTELRMTIIQYGKE